MDSLIQKIYDFGNWLSGVFKACFDFICAVIVQMFNNFVGMFKIAIEYLCKFLTWFFYEVQQFAWDKFTEISKTVFKNNPYAVNVVEWSDNFHTSINCFLPLNELFGVLTVLLTVWLACLVIKVILKLIPTVY